MTTSARGSAGMPAPRPSSDGPAAVRCGDDGAPLTEDDAEAQVHGIAFKTGPPGRVGVELEWLVRRGHDPALPVDQQRLAEALALLGDPEALPGQGRLTIEPGGQVEISSAPAAGVGECVSAVCGDLSAVRQAASLAGLSLAGQGLDPHRPPRRILEQPRYAAMEEFFDRSGPWGRVMMCSTASVQVCVDAGDDTDGTSGFRWRWRLLHAIGPVLVAAFANSPLRRGVPSGWKSTRQAVWARLDPTRTRPPPRAEPAAGSAPNGGRPGASDPRSAWAAYALDAKVMCVRREDSPGWTAPAGLTFRDWLRGGGDRRPTAEDLAYHLTTLFPPVRPRGHLELRMIDAQPGDSWVVPAAVVTALADDPAAAEAAMTAAEPVWRGPGPAPSARGDSPWLRAARCGPDDPQLASASERCFEAAGPALARLGAPAPVRHAVAAFADRYVAKGRCPADDRLDEARNGAGRQPGAHPTPLEESQ